MLLKVHLTGNGDKELLALRAAGMQEGESKYPAFYHHLPPTVKMELLQKIHKSKDAIASQTIGTYRSN